MACDRWTFLEVETFAGFKDEVQAYGAGLVEAAATKSFIVLHWSNTMDGYCDGAEDYCSKLHKYLKTNLEWLTNRIQSNPNDPYWHQIHLIMTQLAGLEDGFTGKALKPHISVDANKLLMLQLSGDLGVLERVLKKPKHLWKDSFASGSCSAFIKPVKDELFVSHVTWNTYNAMLRVQKLYDFKFTATGKLSDSSKIKGHRISMSSYPGVLDSIDDFYLSSAKLAITETTNENYNVSLFAFVQPNNTVPTWLRALVANRLSSSGQEWVTWFSKYNSGTYNNQWMIVDYKRFSSGTAKNGLLYVLEQIPGYIRAEDQTKLLFQQGYWPSYNLPFYKDVFNKSANWVQLKKYGDFFSYEKCPRAQMFKRMWKSVKDESSLISLMRYNNFKEDPLAKCKCKPPYSGENAISARCDLNPANGTYPFSTLGFRCHGGTDMKATSVKLMQNLQFIAISGPTYDPLPAFSWKSSPCAKSMTHQGHPDTFRFKPVTYTWTN